MDFDRTKYIKEQTEAINVRLLKSDPLYRALSQASEDLEIPKTRYIKIALLEKLRKEGYIKSTDIVIIKGPGSRNKFTKNL